MKSKQLIYWPAVVLFCWLGGDPAWLCASVFFKNEACSEVMVIPSAENENILSLATHSFGCNALHFPSHVLFWFDAGFPSMPTHLSTMQ